MIVALILAFVVAPLLIIGLAWFVSSDAAFPVFAFIVIIGFLYLAV